MTMNDEHLAWKPGLGLYIFDKDAFDRQLEDRETMQIFTQLAPHLSSERSK
jgi:hypothetical protein